MPETTHKRCKSKLSAAFLQIIDISPLDLIKGATSIIHTYRAHRAHKRAELIRSIAEAIRE